MCSEKDLLLQPPLTVKGMKLLDKDAFFKVVSVPFFSLGLDLNSCLSILKLYLLKLPSFKPVQDSKTEQGKKDVVLDPSLVSSFDNISEDDRVKLYKLGLAESDLKWKDVTLGYDNWKADVILKAILPDGVSNVTGFSVVGHIIHLNLKDEHVPFKNVIGAVLLDKMKNIRTVVNKLNTIDNTYRNFSMEVLAGCNDTMVLVKENGCQFEFDFSVVYWNPRLSTEHERVVSKLKSKDIFFDVFAGVGPFAIPAGKKGCTVYANDLNPESSRWLVHNAKKNNVLDKVHVFTLDGREFITTIVRNKLLEVWRNKTAKPNIHVVMNLPAMAVEFLDSFSNLFIGEDVDVEANTFSSPMVHCYCFVKCPQDFKSQVQTMVEQNLHGCVNSETCEVVFVRNVAPNKDMYRASFHLPFDVLFGFCKENAPELKKIKLTE